MSVRSDAPPGQALNRAVATDARGNQAVASANLLIERETIAGRMTLIGRITRGDCALTGPREGIPGVRVVLEDGSFALTDADGRYHFEGLVPGTHVAQAQASTPPGTGSKFVDCTASSRSAGTPNSRFVTGRGGSLVVADFAAIVGENAAAAAVAPVVKETAVSDPAAAGAGIDFVGMGDGPDDFLFPALDHNPRAPAVRVAIRHRAGHTVELSVDGKPAGTIFTLDSLPAQVEVYVGDFAGAGPATGAVLFAVQNGAALTYAGANDLKYSSTAAAPASFAACACVPAATNAYDPAIRHVCVNPKGVLASGSPAPGSNSARFLFSGSFG